MTRRAHYVGISAFLLCLFGVPLLTAQAGFERRVVYTGGREGFADAALLSRAEEELAGRRERVLIVWMYPDQGEASKGVFGGPLHVVPLSYAPKLLARNPIAARLVAIGSEAVLTVRRADGRVGRLVLGEADPLLFAVGSIEYEIVNVAATDLGHITDVRVQVRTSGSPDAEEYARVATMIREKFGIGQIWSVTFRRDYWFDDLAYPLFAKNLTPGSLPDKSTWVAPDMRCSAIHSKPFQCR